MSEKVCACCKQTKLVTEFNKDRQKKDGLMSYCKACNSVKTASFYSKTKQTSRSYKKRGGLSVNEYAAVWRQENKEKYQSYIKKWQSKNRHKLREKNMRRYVRQTQQTPTWLNKGHKAEIEGFYLFCQIFKGYQVDHIVPIRGKQVSGMHVPWNLQVLTAEQNRAKSNFFNELEYI
jgi:hypothetical protein